MGRMTIVCKDCTHQYGRWRPRCPACGTVNPEPEQAGVEAMTREERAGRKGRVKLPKPFNEPKLRVVKRPCAVCGKGGAKHLCLVCGAPMHGGCRSLHQMKCKFVSSCDHNWVEQPGEPARDVCNSCGEERH